MKKLNEKEKELTIWWLLY